MPAADVLQSHAKVKAALRPNRESRCEMLKREAASSLARPLLSTSLP